MDAELKSPIGARLADGPVRQGEVGETYSNLQYAISDVLEAIELLEDRLRPVLRQEPNVGADRAETAPSFSTDLGNAINEQVLKVRRAQYRINAIRERVEL